MKLRLSIVPGTLVWMGLLLLAVLVYVGGLGGQYIPSNGDELVYAHIARLTAASGHWLPLVSDLDHMRNTKPPLLFWQAMVAGNWGCNWHMVALRTPSVVYSLLVAVAIILAVRQITQQWGLALMTACIYLAFFCTFRYGRAYLTSAPETFWLNVPMFYGLWRAARANDCNDSGAGLTVPQGWLVHLILGLALGLGLAYKSFALLAPAAAAWWCAELCVRSALTWREVWRITLGVSVSAMVALAVFGLWFVLDPDPNAVWQEFVLAENAGKLSNNAGYWQTALMGGGFSIWAQLLAYVQNAGLLAFVVLGLMAWGVGQIWRVRHAGLGWMLNLPPVTRILLVWLGVWLLVFILPSQRSARYLIPAMPALAMLMALYWSRIARGWFVPSLALCGVLLAFLGRIAWAAHDIGIGSTWQLTMTLLVMGIGLALVGLGLQKPCWTRTCTVAAVLAVFATFSMTVAPLNGPAGQYHLSERHLPGQPRIAVPSSFNGQFERFWFLLPRSVLVAYDGEARATMSATDNAVEQYRLLANFDAIVWLQTPAETTAPLCAPQCRVLDGRWEVKGRHRSGEITLSNLWYPQRWLFRREWLITALPPNTRRYP